MDNIMIFVTFALSTSTIFCHDKNELDYWIDEEFSLDDSYKVHLTPIPEQIKYMIKPGGHCTIRNHQTSLIRHFAVRHGLTIATKRQFREILNNICSFVPSLAVLDFYQVMTCEMKRCVCPFGWLTWSNDEKMCKIRETNSCDRIKMLNTTIDLNKVFGCEEGTGCVTAGADVVRKCLCKKGQVCGVPRRKPSQSPFSSSPVVISFLTSFETLIFTFFTFFLKELD